MSNIKKLEITIKITVPQEHLLSLNLDEALSVLREMYKVEIEDIIKIKEEDIIKIKEEEE